MLLDVTVCGLRPGLLSALAIWLVSLVCGPGLYPVPASASTAQVHMLAARSVGVGSGEVKGIVVGTEGSYPPMNFLDKSGKPAGFEVDLAKAVCGQMRVSCRIVPQDWDGLVPALLSRKIDMIASSVSATAARRRVIEFSDPYFVTGAVFLVKKSASLSFLGKLSLGLDGVSIGVQRGTVFEAFLARSFPQAKTELYAGYEEAFLDLKTGRLDAVLGEGVACDYFMGKPANRGFFLVPLPKDSNFEPVAFAFGLRKSDGALKKKVNHALDVLRSNGSYSELLRKWNVSSDQGRG